MIYGRELPGRPYNLKAKLTRCIIWGQRNLFSRIHPVAGVCPINHSLGVDEANRLISRLLESNRPCMVARFGSGELEATMRGFCCDESGNVFAKSLRMLTGESGPFWWDNSIVAGLCWVAGFFPPEPNMLMRFSRLMRDDAGQLDLLGSWTDGERKLQKACFPTSNICLIGELNPFFASEPWTRSLRGKKVLLVHPFVDTIRAQYARREKLFANPDILPDFELLTYRSVSSFGGIQTKFENWFDALEKMKSDIAKLDFDVAIIGCGAYGFPLAAFIKRELRRKAVHLGGMTQVLFGIKGKRWERTEIARLYNASWVRPLGSETVETAQKIEGGAYW